MQRLVQRLILAAALLILPGSATALMFDIGDSIQLQALLDGETIEVGGLLFDGFSYVPNGAGIPDANNVTVVAIEDLAGNVGIRFVGGFAAVEGASPSDALIGFAVSVTQMGTFINSAHLLGNPDVQGTGLAGVTEQLVPAIDQLNIFDNGSVAMLAAWSENEFEETTLNILKDIILFADGEESKASLSFVDQTFGVVPEPGTAMLLGLGLSGLAFAGRRRQS